MNSRLAKDRFQEIFLANPNWGDKMRKFLPALAVLWTMLGACSEHQGYWPSEADNWQGKKLEDFTREHGAPQSSARLNERGDYIYMWSQTLVGQLDNAQCETAQSGQIACEKQKRWERTCTYTLVTNPDKVIRQSFLDGDCSWL